MTKTAPIPEEDLARSRRKMCRRIAAVLVRTMAETDMDFAALSVRTRHSEQSLRDFIHALIDGEAPRNSLDMISDFALAMDCEIEFHIVKRAEPLDAAESEEALP